jgi:phage FluMu protein Com
MIRQCAWCNKVLGEVEPLDNKATTHGICPECVDKYFPKEKDNEKV